MKSFDVSTGVTWCVKPWHSLYPRPGRTRRRTTADLTVAEKLGRLLDEYVLPLIARKLVGAVVKVALNTPEVLALFYDAHEALYAIFDEYSDATLEGDEAGNLSDGLMTSSEFQLVVEDARLLGASRADIDDELTHKEVRQAFAAAQTEVAFGAEEKHAQAAYQVSHLQLMSYPEFVEAVARVGALKWEEGAVTIFEKIEHAVTAITEIHSRRSKK
jgi:hypothetical protein